MRKAGGKNKRYSPEFKISVIMDMREHHLSYRETVRKYELPKMRNIRQCVRIWNNTHKRSGQMIDKHTVERCIKDKRVFAYHYGNRWIINYIQLEQVIAEFFAKTDYKIRRLKRKKVSK